MRKEKKVYKTYLNEPMNRYNKPNLRTLENPKITCYVPNTNVLNSL